MSVSEQPSVAATAMPGRRFSSPLARALAHQYGLDWTALAGSGPRGRVLKADVQAACDGQATQAGPDSPSMPGHASFKEIAHSFSRRTIARRLTQSSQQVPHFYLRADCDIDALLHLRASLQPQAKAQGLRLSVNDFVIAAAAAALREVPDLNVSFTEAAMRHYQQIHVAVAVATQGGLVTPVIRDADHHNVFQIAREMQRLTMAAHSATLAPGASGGGTFTISNLGGAGVQEFSAIINPPQAAILAVGAGQPRVVARQGQVSVATVMTVVLSVDHRAVDGQQAARWMAALQRQLEHPQAPANMPDVAPVDQAATSAMPSG